MMHPTGSWKNSIQVVVCVAYFGSSNFLEPNAGFLLTFNVKYCLYNLEKSNSLPFDDNAAAKVQAFLSYREKSKLSPL
jgi:hypothetical protein